MCSAYLVSGAFTLANRRVSNAVFAPSMPRRPGKAKPSSSRNEPNMVLKVLMACMMTVSLGSHYLPSLNA